MKQRGLWCHLRVLLPLYRCFLVSSTPKTLLGLEAVENVVSNHSRSNHHLRSILENRFPNFTPRDADSGVGSRILFLTSAPLDSVDQLGLGIDL